MSIRVWQERKQKMTAKILCGITVILVCCGLYFSIRRARWQVLTFYTQLSNIAAACSALLYVLAGPGDFVTAFRFTGNCMLIMTFLVVIFILIPMGASAKVLLLGNSGFFHHLMVPIVSVVSYVFFEPHAPRIMILAPAVVTFAYGMIMLYLNGIGKVDGPYPFLRVRQQSALKTVLWMCALFLLISGIGFGLWAAAH